MYIHRKRITPPVAVLMNIATGAGTMADLPVPGQDNPQQHIVFVTVPRLIVWGKRFGRAVVKIGAFRDDATAKQRMERYSKDLQYRGLIRKNIRKAQSIARGWRVFMPDHQLLAVVLDVWKLLGRSDLRWSQQPTISRVALQYLLDLHLITLMQNPDAPADQTSECLYTPIVRAI